MRRRSIWNYFISFYFFHRFYFYKLINKFNLRGGRRQFLEAQFIEIMWLLKFYFEKPLIYFFRFIKNYIPYIGYRKRSRYVKQKKTKLSVSKIDDLIFIKDRRTRKKMKDKKKVRKGKAKGMGRKRPHVKPKKQRKVYPWVFTKYKRYIIGLKWFVGYIRQVLLSQKKVRIPFFKKMFYFIMELMEPKDFHRALRVKRRMYKIVQKTRLGLHFRW